MRHLRAITKEVNVVPARTIFLSSRLLLLTKSEVILIKVLLGAVSTEV